VAVEEDAGPDLPRSWELDAVSQAGLERLREAIAAVLGTCEVRTESAAYGVSERDCCRPGGHPEDSSLR
jgi:hypothetical protein